jgi:transcriptional regulator with XRE-family HTH domain
LGLSDTSRSLRPSHGRCHELVDYTRTPSPTEVVSRRVREVRERRAWTQEKLANRCARAGAPRLTTQVIADLETGRRLRLSIDEVLVLSSVLGIAPIHLMVPLEGRVQVGSKIYAAKRLRGWIRGEGPLRDADQWTYFSEVPRQERVFPAEVRFTLSDQSKRVAQAEAGARSSTFYSDSKQLEVALTEGLERTLSSRGTIAYSSEQT